MSTTTATLLKAWMHSRLILVVTTEPHLQPLTGETMSHRPAITDSGARLDFAMYGFWGGRFENTFLDDRVLNPNAQSNQHGSLTSIHMHRRHEQEKRQYEQCVREVEHATSTPLVISTTGGMGRATTTFYKGLESSTLREKRDTTYGKTTNWRLVVP